VGVDIVQEELHRRGDKMAFTDGFSLVPCELNRILYKQVKNFLCILWNLEFVLATPILSLLMAFVSGSGNKWQVSGVDWS